MALLWIYKQVFVDLIIRSVLGVLGSLNFTLLKYFDFPHIYVYLSLF